MSKIQFTKTVKKVHQKLDLTFLYFLKKEYLVKHPIGLKDGHVFKIENSKENPNFQEGETSLLIYETEDTFFTFDITVLEIIPNQLIKLKILMKEFKSKKAEKERRELELTQNEIELNSKMVALNEEESVLSWIRRKFDYDYISTFEFEQRDNITIVIEKTIIDGDVPISFIKKIAIKIMGLLCLFSLRKRNKIIIQEVEHLRKEL